MNRRLALKQLGVITAGVALLPGCVKEAPKAASIALKHLNISGTQESVVAELAETLIPSTDLPGAKAMNLQQFVLRMVDDCQPSESQQEFVKGLQEFQTAVDKKFGKSFDALSSDEKKAFLIEVDAAAQAEREKDNMSAVSKFYSLTRRYTVQGFTTSEYVLTEVLPYNMLPGKFLGCVPVTDKNDIKTIIG